MLQLWPIGIVMINWSTYADNDTQYGPIRNDFYCEIILQILLDWLISSA